MLFNTTHKNEEYTIESIRILGKAFSLFEKIKMGGVGSSRFTIAAFSKELQPKGRKSQAINYANIELRPKGIIVHFTDKLDRYSWVIPYFRLVVYNAQTFSIHANGHFIKCEKNKYYRDNKKFINKMTNLKNKTLGLGYYDA